MLNVMRENLRHLKWVLIIVAASLLLYLGYYFDPGLGTGGATADWAARVDGKAIPTQEFIQIARSQDEFYRKLLGGQYEQMKKNLRVGSQSIQSLVDRHLVLTEAKALGLEATASEISKAILESPNFKDASGNFVGKERYAEFIGQSVEGGVPVFERRLADDILTRKWIDVMTASARVSDVELEQAWKARNVRAAMDYVLVPSSSVPFDAAVDAATAGAWYAAHTSDYTRPEGRKLRLAVVDRQAQTSKVALTDADIEADYAANRTQFERPEQRHARHILLKLPDGGSDADKRSIRELAESVLARARGGEDFAALARSMSQDTASATQGGDLGWFGRGAMVPAFEEAVFATSPGSFAPVVETEYGFHVVQVLEARAAGVAPLAEVKDGIRRRLELQKAHDIALAEAQKLKNEVATPGDLDAAAAKAGLKVEERLVSSEDRAADLGPSPELATAMTTLQVGQVVGPLGVARGFAVVACVEVLPAAVRPLTDVMDRVKSDVLNERARASALSAARRIAAGASLETGAKPLKLEVQKSGDLSPGAALPGVGASPEIEAALFGAATRVGAAGAVATEGGALAYRITRHDAFDGAKFEADKPSLRTQVLQQRRDQLTQALIQELRQKHAIEINQALVESVDG